ILPREPTESNLINNVTKTQDDLTIKRDINVTNSQEFDENTTDPSNKDETPAYGIVKPCDYFEAA
ncbi:11999_t:CDS:2, partial [Gigaspora margarita]